MYWFSKEREQSDSILRKIPAFLLTGLLANNSKSMRQLPRSNVSPKKMSGEIILISFLMRCPCLGLIISVIFHIFIEGSSCAGSALHSAAGASIKPTELMSSGWLHEVQGRVCAHPGDVYDRSYNDESLTENPERGKGIDWWVEP